jgi:hypothetical protein
LDDRANLFADIPRAGNFAGHTGFIFVVVQQKNIKISDNLSLRPG